MQQSLETPPPHLTFFSFFDKRMSNQPIFKYPLAHYNNWTFDDKIQLKVYCQNHSNCICTPRFLKDYKYFNSAYQKCAINEGRGLPFCYAQILGRHTHGLFSEKHVHFSKLTIQNVLLFICQCMNQYMTFDVMEGALNITLFNFQCMNQYITFEVMEGAYDISCPDQDCPNQVIINKKFNQSINHNSRVTTDSVLLSVLTPKSIKTHFIKPFLLNGVRSNCKLQLRYNSLGDLFAVWIIH